MAETAVGDAFTSGRFRNQIMMPFHAVRRKIGKPDKCARRCVADRKGSAVFALFIAAVRAAPIVPIFRHAGPIVRPSTWIGAAFQSGNPQGQLFTCGACDAEVKPLGKFRFPVLADRKIGRASLNRMDDDIAAVERSIDVGYGHKSSLIMERG